MKKAFVCQEEFDQHLKSMNIETIGQLAALPLEKLLEYFGNSYVNTFMKRPEALMKALWSRDGNRNRSVVKPLFTCSGSWLFSFSAPQCVFIHRPDRFFSRGCCNQLISQASVLLIYFSVFSF
jgi:hypothetical protein